MVGLANNHILDFGEQGLKETLQVFKQAGILTCGAGSKLFEAQKPILIEKQGIKVAYIAIAEKEFSIARFDRAGAAPLETMDNTVQIENASSIADLVFVTVHGGNEYYSFPRLGLRKICRYFIDRGADGVICHHPHVPGAYEFYQGKPIVYNLGNLIFDHTKSPPCWNEGYALRVDYDIEKMHLMSYENIPYTQSV